MSEVGMNGLCDCCGAKLREYKHTLSVPLVQGLDKLAMHGGGPVNLKELGLTRNQWDNFQKLRYFGLVEQCYGAGGTRRNGVWEITPSGRLFLAGKKKVRKSVWTFRGESERWDGPRVTVYEVMPGYKQRADYAAEAVPHPVRAAS